MNAVLFYPGIAIARTPDLSDIVFDSIRGYVVAFSLGSGSTTRYQLFNLTDFPEGIYTDIARLDYYKLDMVQEHFKDDSASLNDVLKLAKLDLNLLTAASDGHIIDFKVIEIPDYSSIFTSVQYSWSHKVPNRYGTSSGWIKLPKTHVRSYPPVTLCVEASSFYLNNIATVASPSFPQNDKQGSAVLLALISLRINLLVTQIFPALFAANPHDDYLQEQYHEWSTNSITASSKSEYNTYYARISAYYNSLVYNFRHILSAPTSESKLFWIAQILTADGLGVVPLKQRLGLLRYIASQGIAGEAATAVNKFFIWIFENEKIEYVVNDEHLVLKLISSVDASESSEFLDALVAEQYNLENQSTIFSNLYDKVDDRGPGAWNRRAMMEGLYTLWVQSAHFPYTVLLNTLDPDVAIPNAQILADNVKDAIANDSNFAANAVFIDYEATDFLWLFKSTNYNFYLKGPKIEAYKDEMSEVSESTTSVFHGSYDIYQGVTIRNTDANTDTIRFMTYGPGGNKNAIIPIFLLMYIDDKKRTDNIETAIELTLDVAMTISAVGNIAKLRHLRHLGRFNRAMIGREIINEGESVAGWTIVQIGNSAIQVSSTAAAYYIKYVEDFRNTYCNPNSPLVDPQKCADRETLYNFLLLAQFLSLGVDLVASRAIKKIC